MTDLPFAELWNHLRSLRRHRRLDALVSASERVYHLRPAWPSSRHALEICPCPCRSGLLQSRRCHEWIWALMVQLLKISDASAVCELHDLRQTKSFRRSSSEAEKNSYVPA